MNIQELLSSVDWSAVILIAVMVLGTFLVYTGKIKISTPEDIRILERALDLAESAAGKTSSTLDDKAVDFIRGVIEDILNKQVGDKE